MLVNFSTVVSLLNAQLPCPRSMIDSALGMSHMSLSVSLHHGRSEELRKDTQSLLIQNMMHSISGAQRCCFVHCISLKLGSNDISCTRRCPRVNMPSSCREMHTRGNVTYGTRSNYCQAYHGQAERRELPGASNRIHGRKSEAFRQTMQQ
jgi:hypothetical protein